MGSRRHPLPPSVAAAIFFVLVGLLYNGGHLGSLDAGNQLQSALHWTLTGKLGADDAPGGYFPMAETKPVYGSRRIPLRFWWPAPNGRYYQTHDIGNTLSMLPVVALTAKRNATWFAQVENPPTTVRFLVTLQFGAMNALTGTFLFYTLCLFHKRKTAFVLAFLYAFGTFAVAYNKTVWDVTMAALLSSVLMYLCARTAVEEKLTHSRAALIGFALGMVFWFRYSYGPFALLAVIGFFLWFHKSTLTKIFWNRMAFLFVAFSVAISVTFIHNQIRMGQFWTPATMIPRYTTAIGLEGNWFIGFTGLLISPHKGLFVFCPFLLLSLTIPFVPIPKKQNMFILPFLLGGFLYIAVLGKIPNWDTFGWGTRYAVPALPIFYAGACLVGLSLKSWGKTIAVTLLFLSCLINAPVALLDWSGVLGTLSTEESRTWNFSHQKAMGTALLNGVLNRPQVVPQEINQEEVAGTDRFPDIWLSYLFRRGTTGKIASIALFAAICMGLLLSYRALRLNDEDMSRIADSP